MTKPQLGTAGEWDGQWHVPEDPDTKLTGRLRYEPIGRGVTLALQGSFQPLEGVVRAGDTRDYPLVHGVLETGEAATLVQAQQMGRQVAFASGGLVVKERLWASYALVGCLASADSTYTEGRFQIPGLAAWLAQRPITQSFEDKDLVLRVSRGIQQRLGLSGIAAKVEFGTGLSTEGEDFRRRSVSVHGFVTVTPDAPQSVSWYLDIYTQVTTLLALLAGGSVAAESIDLYCESDRSRPKTLLCAAQFPGVCKFTQPHEFLLTAPSLDLLPVWDRWFSRYSAIRDPMQLARSAETTREQWAHIEFMAYIQALEGFHRAVVGGTYLTEADYRPIADALRAAIPASLTAAHRESLGNRIQYGYEYSLRRRLTDLADRLHPDIRHILFGPSARVPNRWVETRHYYTHWDEKLREGALDPFGMREASVRMREFLRLLVLKDLGVSDDVLLSALHGQSEAAQDLAFWNALARRRSDPDSPGLEIMRISREPS